jgi:hypothetical protein
MHALQSSACYEEAPARPASTAVSATPSARQRFTKRARSAALHPQGRTPVISLSAHIPWCTGVPVHSYTQAAFSTLAGHQRDPRRPH